MKKLSNGFKNIKTNFIDDFQNLKNIFKKGNEGDNKEGDNKVCRVKLTLAALAIIMPAGMITALMIWRPSTLVNAAISGEMWYLSLVVLITIAVMIVLSGLGFALYKMYKSPLQTATSMRNACTESPIEKSPVPGIWHAVTHIFVLLAEMAKERPLIMLGFAFSYIFPAWILFAYYYGNPHFSAPINWLLNHLLLPISHGLVLPGHAQWLAALCTGFLLAQAWYVIIDFVVKAYDRKISESFIISNLLKLFEKPITNLIGMTFLVSLVYILSGISFFSHLSGSWLMFNLLTIMFKVVVILYDTYKNNIDSTVAKSILFLPRCIAYVLRDVFRHPFIAAEKLMFNIFAAIYAIVELVIYATWQMIRLPIAAFMQASSLRKGSEEKNNGVRYQTTATKLKALIMAKKYLKEFAKGANTSERMDYLQTLKEPDEVNTPEEPETNIKNRLQEFEAKCKIIQKKTNIKNRLQEFEAKCKIIQKKTNINNRLQEFEAKGKIKLAIFKYQILESLKSTFFLFLAVYASIPVFSILITGHIPNSTIFQKFYRFLFDLNNSIDKYLANLICKDILFQCVSIIVCILAIAAIKYQSKESKTSDDQTRTLNNTWIPAKKVAVFALIFSIGATVILQRIADANEKLKEILTNIVNKIWIVLAIAALASVVLVQARKSSTAFKVAGDNYMELLEKGDNYMELLEKFDFEDNPQKQQNQDNCSN